MASGWFIVAPFGASTGSGFTGTVPPGSKVYYATGSNYTILNNDFSSNNATPVIIGGKKWEVVLGPFATKQEAESASPASALSVIAGVVAAGVATAGGGTNPAGEFGAGQQAASNALSGLSAIGDFFSRLAQANTWVRVGKVVVGGLMLIIGVSKMTGADNQIVRLASKIPVI